MGVGVRSIKVMELAMDGAATTSAEAWELGAWTAMFASRKALRLALRWGFLWEVCVCVCVCVWRGGGQKSDNFNEMVSWLNAVLLLH